MFHSQRISIQSQLYYFLINIPLSVSDHCSPCTAPGDQMLNITLAKQQGRILLASLPPFLLPTNKTQIQSKEREKGTYREHEGDLDINCRCSHVTLMYCLCKLFCCVYICFCGRIVCVK